MKTGIGMLLLALGVSVSAAQAQTGKWPVKPVRVITPFAAGGSVDVVARMLAAPLSEEYGQQFIVDNRGGATIGAELAALAKPDGYTFILGASAYTSSAALYKLPYDPVKGVTPVSMVNIGPLIVTVNPSMKAENFKEFLELLRSKPGAFNFGSPGTGSGAHLASALFQQMSGINMVHVPYKSDALAMGDLLSGQVHVIFASGPALLPMAKAGKLRMLAVTTEKRWPTLPELPAVGEFVPGYQNTAWHGVWGPAGIPKDIVARLNQSIVRILKTPSVQERLRADGREPTYSTPEEFGRIIERDVAKWKKVVQLANIKLE